MHMRYPFLPRYLCHHPVLLHRASRHLSRATQPLPNTHPHLFSSPSHLTPGIPRSEYASRRKHLMHQLPNNSTVILLGNPTLFTSQNIFHPFQNNTDFLYLTGLDEPDCIAVFEKNNDHINGYQYTLFLELRSFQHAKWSGPSTSAEMAVSEFQADKVMPNSSFHHYFAQLLNDLRNKSRCLYLDPPPKLRSSNFHPAYLSASELNPKKSWWQQRQPRLLNPSNAVPARPISAIIQKMRAVKSVNEINVMASAGLISGNAFSHAINHVPQLSTEHELQAYLEFQFKLNGGQRSAYVPVVACGRNACTLHYVNNDMPLYPNQLVLVDAGAQYGHYNADISRTFPTKRKFTPEQRDLYSVVLLVQQESIAMISTKSSLDDIHNHSIRLMTQELRKIGFDVNEEIVSQELYFHHVGHHLGLDVHDTPSVSRAQRLEVGNVITIEPGLYVSASTRWPQKYVGIGIRIEDNVALTEAGAQILTESAPKKIEDIESF